MPMTVYVAMPHGAKMHILSRARGAGRKGWVRWTTRCGLTRDWNMADHPVRLPLRRTGVPNVQGERRP